MGIEGIDDFLGLSERCETRHSSGRCADQARYAIDRADNTTTMCCSQCLPGVNSGEGTRRIIQIRRVGRSRK